MRIATSFSPVKPKYTASGRNRAGHITSFNTVATPVGAKSFKADQGQRGSQYGNIADGLGNDHGIMDPAGAGQHTQGNTDNDGVRDNAF